MSRVDSDGTVSVRQASGGERLHPCSKTKRSAPCGSVVQVYVNPYDHNEAIAWFCREHVNLDFFDENAVLEDPPTAPAKAEKKTREAPPPKVRVEKRPEPPKDGPIHFARVNLAHFLCTTCDLAWAENIETAICPKCGAHKGIEHLASAGYVDVKMVDTGPFGTAGVIHTLLFFKEAHAKPPSTLVIHGYDRPTGAPPTEPPPELELGDE